MTPAENNRRRRRLSGRRRPRRAAPAAARARLVEFDPEAAHEKAIVRVRQASVRSTERFLALRTASTLLQALAIAVVAGTALWAYSTLRAPGGEVLDTPKGPVVLGVGIVAAIAALLLLVTAELLTLQVSVARNTEFSGLVLAEIDLLLAAQADEEWRGRRRGRRVIKPVAAAGGIPALVDPTPLDRGTVSDVIPPDDVTAENAPVAVPADASAADAWPWHSESTVGRTAATEDVADGVEDGSNVGAGDHPSAEERRQRAPVTAFKWRKPGVLRPRWRGGVPLA